MSRCQAITKRGTQCQHSAKSGLYCSHHLNWKYLTRTQIENIKKKIQPEEKGSYCLVFEGEIPPTETGIKIHYLITSQEADVLIKGIETIIDRLTFSLSNGVRMSLRIVNADTGEIVREIDVTPYISYVNAHTYSREREEYHLQSVNGYFNARSYEELPGLMRYDGKFRALEPDDEIYKAKIRKRALITEINRYFTPGPDCSYCRIGTSPGKNIDIYEIHDDVNVINGLYYHNWSIHDLIRNTFDAILD
jgi:hypothetical protein